MMKEAMLSVKDLKVSFYKDTGSVQVVRGFDMDVNKGEIVGVLGESGSGKTVSVSGILRLMDDMEGFYDTGEILYEGKDIMKLKRKKPSDKLGAKRLL